MSTDPFTSGLEAGAALWELLDRPLDHKTALACLIGVPPTAVGRLARLLVAAGPEADALLDGLPALVRQLRNSTGSRPLRLQGHLRGPVLWGETQSARAGSAGAHDLFVCASPYRDFDVAENRVLAFVLEQVALAAADVALMPTAIIEGDLGRCALANGRRARAALRHRGLGEVARRRPDPRQLARARASRAHGAYRGAFAVLERIDDPVRFEDLATRLDRRTRVQHGLVLAVVEELARRDVSPGACTVEEGMLRIGPVGYRHPAAVPPSRETGQFHGVLVGEFLLDVPDSLRLRDRGAAQAALERRAGGRPCRVILDAADVAPAVAEALAVATLLR